MAMTAQQSGFGLDALEFIRSTEINCPMRDWSLRITDICGRIQEPSSCPCTRRTSCTVDWSVFIHESHSNICVGGTEPEV